MESASIFISYRRTDAGGYAGRIYDRLTNHFGTAAVFMDTAAIPPGADFMRLIQTRIASSSVFVAIIGDDWLAVDGAGTTRMERLNDPVRLEVETAIKHNVRIIPVLVGCARAFDPSRVSAPVNQIASLNAISVTNEMFDDCMRRLIRALEPLIGSPKRHGRSGSKGGRRVLLVGAPAAAGTALTLWIFETSMTTGDIPFSLGETSFVFLIWLVLSASIFFVLEKLRKRRSIN